MSASMEESEKMETEGERHCETESNGAEPTAESEGTSAECGADSGAELDASKPEADGTHAAAEAVTSAPLMTRVQLMNLPPYTSYKQIKVLLAKNLKGITVRKIRHMGDTTYFNVESAEIAEKAVSVFSGFEIKGYKVSAKLAALEPMKGRDVQKNVDSKPRDVRESVTPLANLPYSEQLDLKMDGARGLVANLVKQLIAANVRNARSIDASKLLLPIRGSPRVSGYRNKCEFTVGHDLDGNVRVGFVGGRFAANEHFILPVQCCDNISQQMKRIVDAFEQFVIDSNEPPFNEFERIGVWKMLTVREFGGDVMVIATVFPIKDKEKDLRLRAQFAANFLRADNLSNPQRGFRVTSVYWQQLANASDQVIYEHVAGTPYIYETILDTRFRVSPGAFFQTNSSGAAVLYSTIAEKCGFDGWKISNDEGAGIASNGHESLPETSDVLPNEGDDTHVDGAPVEKKIKVDPEKQVEVVSAKSSVVLDICCGTGTIGIVVMKMLTRAKLPGRRFLLGVEVCSEAVEDAQSNARDNELSDDECRYVAAKAEDVFRKLHYYVPSIVNLEESNVVGIVDPPRAGIHEKVICGCRTLSSLRRLVFVSCNPSLALKNIVDLCRPTSKKYSGEPFAVTSVTPVDMFPQTRHCEWVVQLDR